MKMKWRIDPLDIALRNRLGYRQFYFNLRKYLADGQRITATAELLGIPLATFTEQLAEELGFPYIASVPLLSLSILPRRIGFAELRRLDFVPLSSEGVVAGIICLNPTKIRAHFPKWAHLPIFIATPIAITQTLDLSEQSLGASPALKTPQREEFVLEVVTRMMEHTQALGEELFFLRETLNQLAYEVRPKQGQSKRGFIAGAVAAEVLALCAEHAAHKKILSLSDGKYLLAVSLADDNSEYCVRKVDQLSVAHTVEDLPIEMRVTTNRSGHQGATVFIVDDNRDFLRVLEKFLSRAGFNVVCFTGAAQVVHHIDHSREWPQVLVTDLHMPVTSGMELVEELSRRYDRELPPIIFLTSDESIDSEIGALRRGAIGFIPKSRDPRLLVAHLERICGNSSLCRAA